MLTQCSHSADTFLRGNVGPGILICPSFSRTLSHSLTHWLTHSLNRTPFPPHPPPPCPQALSEEADAAAAEVARLETADIGSMWAQDLDDFMEVRVLEGGGFFG
jgi:hypothetical protein